MAKLEDAPHGALGVWLTPPRRGHRAPDFYICRWERR